MGSIIITEDHFPERIHIVESVFINLDGIAELIGKNGNLKD